MLLAMLHWNLLQSSGAVYPLLLSADRWGDQNHTKVSGIVFGFLLRLVDPRALCVVPQVRCHKVLDNGVRCSFGD